MRPHVISRDQQPVRKGTFHGDRESLVAAVVSVASPAHLAKCRVGACSGKRIDDIHFRKSQQMGALGADVRNRADKILRQGLLHGQSPLRDRSILAPAVVVARRDDSLCWPTTDRWDRSGWESCYSTTSTRPLRWSWEDSDRRAGAHRIPRQRYCRSFRFRGARRKQHGSAS